MRLGRGLQHIGVVARRDDVHAAIKASPLALPFLFFLWRGAFGPELSRRLWVIFALGALQGAVGWWISYSMDSLALSRATA